jgi:hypothetical protein
MHKHTASKKKKPPSGNQTWLAGKSTIRDDFPSSKPPVMVIFPIFSPDLLIEFSIFHGDPGTFGPSTVTLISQVRQNGFCRVPIGCQGFETPA